MQKAAYFLACLALITITLKILGIITWSWWLVLTPIWIIIGCIALGILAMIAYFKLMRLT